MADLNAWIDAFRPRTLPLAASSILVGSSLAAFQGVHRPEVTVLALLTAVLLQVLSNLANDLGDHEHGTDNADRVGPSRAVQSGAIDAASMRRAMMVCAGLALASGCALIVVALGYTLSTLLFLLLGLMAIGAAVRYTYGSKPYGYAGLGDLSVFLFFGVVGVVGTHFLHIGRPDPLSLLPAMAFGMLSTGVLNVNNMRDIRNDKASGKITLAVRLGLERSRSYHSLLVIGGLLGLVAFTGTHFRTMPQWGFLATTSLLATHLRAVLRNSDPQRLDTELKRLALGTFATAIAFSAGLWLAS
jgi:1,4-dihydroxy-2-naphthoate octaprenyltransferase